MADLEEEAANKWYEHKSMLVESMLGEEHGMVMHAIIPYALGGGLDLLAETGWQKQGRELLFSVRRTSIAPVPFSTQQVVIA